MNTKIQKLIHYNEKVLAHFDGRHKLDTSDLLDCFIFSSRILQDLVKNALETSLELKQGKLQGENISELNKQMMKAVFSKEEVKNTGLSSLYNLSVSYKNSESRCQQLEKENAQLRAELEIEKQINKF